LSYSSRLRNKKADKQTGRQTDRQALRQACRQPGTPTETKIKAIQLTNKPTHCCATSRDGEREREREREREKERHR
jgi:hypothetical protein